MTERLGKLASALLVASLALPRVSLAAAPEAAPVVAEASDEPSEASVRAALADGDLTLARERAVALREAEPTLEHFELEADVHAALGDHARTKRALRGALERVPEGDAAKREAIEDRLDEVIEQSRGAVADEPTSSERERLDDERAERLAALHPPPPTLVPVDKPVAPPVPSVRKCYFWVTLTTIVGAAVAITAVAIDSNLDNGKSASRLPGNPASPSAGGLTLRF